MPVGLNNGPATFQRTLNILLSGFNWWTCHIYFNDVIMYSKSFDAHLKDVDIVLSTLREASVSLNLKKYCFSTLQTA